MLRLRLASALALSTLAACDPAPVAVDAGFDAAAADAGMPDAGRPPDVCDELALPRAAFVTAGAGTVQGDIAGDFTVATTTGTYTLSESWSGCESYVFFVHLPGFTDTFIRTVPDDLFSRGVRNVQYFYLSADDSPDGRAALMAELTANLEGGLALLSVEDAEFWRSHFHFVTDHATEIPGSIGGYLRDYLAYRSDPSSVVTIDASRRAAPPVPLAFAIDRGQRWDPVDSLNPNVVEDERIGMAAWLGHFYDYRYELEERLRTEAGVTVVSLLDETTTGRIFTPTVTLPAAADTAGRLEIDVVVDCTARNPFACSEWDRIASIAYCVDGETCADRREITRWITPYWRRGRQHYAIDATPFLGLLGAGSATFRIELGPEWERATEWDVSVSLRFGAGTERATDVVAAFGGGTFDATYNGRPSVTFTPPATATRVELVTILSGHGQVSGNNCAEWCDHRHTFSVNGTALPTIMHADAPIGDGLGCAAHADEGWIPGQWGNGAPMRAYWCPGLAVEALRTDVTSLVTLGAENTLDYAATFRTGAPAGGDIALSSYLVYYE